MKFATIGHLLVEENIEQFPESWVSEKLIVSPEVNVNGTSGYITGLTLDRTTNDGAATRNGTKENS